MLSRASQVKSIGHFLLWFLVWHLRHTRMCCDSSSWLSLLSHYKRVTCNWGIDVSPLFPFPALQIYRCKKRDYFKSIYLSAGLVTWWKRHICVSFMSICQWSRPEDLNDLLVVTPSKGRSPQSVTIGMKRGTQSCNISLCHWCYMTCACGIKTSGVLTLSGTST